MKIVIASSLLVATCTTATPAPNPKTQAFNWNTTRSLIAFGDSYTFIQGTLGHTNYSFISDAFNLSFTPSQLFSNRIVLNQTSTAQGTAEGGPNWVEFLTGCGDEKGFTNPQNCPVQLWDFAYAGADTISAANFTPSHWNHTVSLQLQAEQFVDSGNPALETIKLKKENSLVAIWIGINDFNDLLSRYGKNTMFPPLYEQDQTYLFESVEKIYSLGYRSFLFMNLPPLDRTPGSKNNITALVNSFNTIHAKHADAFQAEHSDATVLQFDVNAVLNNMLDNYKGYGFKNITNFCPGFDQPDIRTDPGKYGCEEGLDTYFWYNSGHMGSRTHKLFTEVLRKWLIGKSAR